MRKVTDGNGNDSTAAVLAWLKANNELRIANLYLIGELEDPQAVFLTDWESPLVWSPWGTFQPAIQADGSVGIARGSVTSKFGFTVQQLEIKWNVQPPASFASSISAASPYQLARMGYYDNWPVRVWSVYMPTAGDANTFGASELFGGRISKCVVERGVITLTVNSFLDVVNVYVPTNVIELTSSLASYKGATPPAGFSVVPQFKVLAGSNTQTIICDSTTNPGHIFSTNVFRNGYVVFNGGVGSTLGGVWSAVLSNYTVTGTPQHNGIILYSLLPWPPTPGVDTFYISAAAPINQADGSYGGFPFVPGPESAI